jgi:putative flippase GtrA
LAPQVFLKSFQPVLSKEALWITAADGGRFWPGDARRDERQVSVARALYARFQVLIHEFAKFGIIGVIGLVITNGGYYLMRGNGVGPITSTTIPTIVATIVAYLGNRYWSFRHRERTGVGRETVVFFVLNGIGLLIQDAAVGFNSYVLDLKHDWLAGFIALNFGIALATLFRFWSYRKWVWVAPADGEVAAHLRPGASAPASGGPVNGAANGVPAGAEPAGGHVHVISGHARPAPHGLVDPPTRTGSPAGG